MNEVGNKNRKQSMEQREKQLERSKAKFKANSTEQQIPTVSDLSNDTIKDVQKEKSLRKKVQKQAKRIQKKLDQSKQKVISQNKHIRELEEKITKLEKESFDRNQKLSYIENQFKTEVKRRDDAFLHEENLRREAEVKIKSLIAHQQRIQKNGRSRVNLANQVTQLKTSNKSLRKQLEDYDLLTQEKYGNLTKEVKNLRKEIQIFRERETQVKQDPLYLLNYMRSHITDDFIPELIDILQGQITRKNLPYFYRGQQNVFYLLMRRVNLLKFHTNKQGNPYKLRNKTNSNEKQRLGYLIFEDEKWQFVDITQTQSLKTYDVLENDSDIPLSADNPVKARVEQNGVSIMKSYSMIGPSTKQVQHKKKRTSSGVPQKRYLWFGNFKVLIIGSRFLSGYKERLLKHGCEIEVHNPYEESYELLSGKVNRAEIILVCERHIPHSVWDHVDKTQPYVSVLKKDSKELISAFTYLTLQRCELI
ncbi:hypothetical protein VBD025_04985 [Virgibacillus flavescens]|uniref:hypothetical protein n=1 Tax=Virgibacillus flavescens TaxID=1611422 RepID=UPI003D34583D